MSGLDLLYLKVFSQILSRAQGVVVNIMVGVLLIAVMSVLVVVVIVEQDV